MRIEDTKGISYEAIKPQKREDGHRAPAAPNLGTSDAEISRAERIDELKKMFSEGRPIDINKLADKLLESGIFFDEKA